MTTILILILFCQFSVDVQPGFTVSVVTPDPPAVTEKPAAQVSPKRYLAMFTATWCGPCQQWKRTVKPQLESAGYTVVMIEMSDPGNVQKYRRITAYPSFVACDWQTGAWVSDVKTGGIDVATAKWMLDGSSQQGTGVVVAPAAERVAADVVSPPARFINWPGWGQIDLETYSRNCSCSMCVAIRGKQAEYWKLKRLYEQSQSRVTPDQEGCPHDVVEIMLDSMDLRPGDVLADLGCGDGRICIAAAKRGIRSIGIEIDPVRAEMARAAVQKAGVTELVTIETGDAREFDLSSVTCATCYLYPPLLEKLAPKLKGLRVVCSPYHQIPGLDGQVLHGECWIRRI